MRTLRDRAGILDSGLSRGLSGSDEVTCGADGLTEPQRRRGTEDEQRGTE